MNAADGRQFREALTRACAQRLAEGPVALLFSGGTDSLTVLWTLLDLGADVRCYCFRLENTRSADSQAAALAAKTWDVPLEIVAVPDQPLAELARDVGAVAKIVGSTRKTHIEVMWGCWHLLRMIKEKQVWTGLQADTLYGTSRSLAIKYGKRDARSFAQARSNLLGNPGQEGFVQACRLAMHFRKELVAPYTCREVRQFLLRFSWRELNKPRQKMPAVLGFAEEFGQAALYRRNDGMQCGSGTREHMARLLRDPTINVQGRRSMAALYRDLLAASA